MDRHCEMILEEYRKNQPSFEKMRDIVLKELNGFVSETGMLVDGVAARIKTEKSLAGKLELKGSKYKSLSDITDIVGARAITFFNDEVDKIAAMVEKTFYVDWENSIDKRAIYDNDRFGYMSLHYIIRIPKELYFDPEHPEINEYRMEIQMRTCLQHAWASISHDTGYKSDIEVPKEYLRAFSRMAGLLELADDEFKRIRDEIEEYRRKVKSLIADGNFNELELNGDTFKSYIGIGPFDRLNHQIADINHAEIQEVSMNDYLNVFKELKMKTLGDVENMRKTYGDSAYKLALHTFGRTDLDIISSSLGPQNLCLCYIANNFDRPVEEIKKFYDLTLGEKPRNIKTAEKMYELIKNLNLVESKNE